MVELRPITEENFEDCINLDVREEQQDFIAENMCSLAEAYVAMTSGPVVPMPWYSIAVRSDGIYRSRLCLPSQSGRYW